jgi:hypothetical protein
MIGQKDRSHAEGRRWAIQLRSFPHCCVGTWRRRVFILAHLLDLTYDQ